MSASKAIRDPDIGACYIRENFAPTDRVAVLLLNKRTNSVLQRLTTAERLSAPDTQNWLRRQNERRYDVYISMNALSPDAQGRTKADVAEIRHVYLDFDDGGTSAVEALMKREDLPKPNFLIDSSPDKWQVVWKVRDFAKDQAEELQRGLARETGADIAATDCARVLRLPGFQNHKYGRPYMIGVQSLAKEICGPDRFPKLAAEHRDAPIAARDRQGQARRSGPASQSERDWAFAKRALARGESPALVASAIATYRRYDKHNPQAYAELTVTKAARSLRVEEAPEPGRS